MAKPHDDLGVSLEAVPTRTQKSVQPHGGARKICVGVAVAMLAGHVWAQPAPLSSAEQEQRRAQERERLLREQQEKAPDVRLPPAPQAEAARLPASESPCFPIHELKLHAVAGEQAGLAAQFAWAIDAAAGPDADDAPTGRCLGAQGIAIVIKRLQNTVIARGYVTTRILAEPQDLKTGVLTLTVIPGRIRAIRFSDGSDARGNAWTAVPASPGDILNLRDIEQALENFKRVPTAEADIQIEEAKGEGAQPGQSDLVISYKQALPFRASFFADDSGSKATGKYQGGVTLSYDNWWTLNDLFYVSLNKDLGGGEPGRRGTRGTTVHYSVPLGYWTLGATVSDSRYFQSVAGANQDYVYRGTSSNAEVKLSRLVYRDASRKTTLEAATNTSSQSSFKERKESGMLDGDGFGITIGTREQSSDQKNRGTTAAASTVGSIAGNVTLQAGVAYRQVGSDVIAPGGDVTIIAKKVDIVEARETTNSETEQKFKQTGLSVGLSNPVVSAVQTGQQMADAANNTGDGRMQALAGAAAALNGYNTYKSLTNAAGEFDAKKAAEVSVNISLGTSKSQSNSASQSDTARGSTVAAGNNLTIVATGAGQDSNLTAQGANLTAGNNVTLLADNKVNLLAARNDASSTSSNSSSSGSVGVSYGAASGFGVSVSASKGRGNSNGSDTGYHFMIVDSVQTSNGASYYMTRDPASGPRGVLTSILDNLMTTGINAITIGKK